MAIAEPSPRPHSRTTHPVAALVDASDCSAPRLRALAAQLAGRGAVVIGSTHDAVRAAGAGLRVVGCCAPPLGNVSLAGSSLRLALGGPRQFGTVVVAGRRAHEAARVAGLRAEPMTDVLPEPVDAIDRAALRSEWGVAEDESACVLLANPAGACDARVALDIAGRASLLGGPVVLVVHPDAGNVVHARRLASAAGGAWRLAEDARAEDPELLAAGADAFLALAVRTPAEARAEAPRGLGALMSAFARGGRPAAATAETLGIRLALRAGIAVVAAEDVPGADAVPVARRFATRRPNVAAKALREAFDVRR